jgi:hypothetical protein
MPTQKEPLQRADDEFSSLSSKRQIGQGFCCFAIPQKEGGTQSPNCNLESIAPQQPIVQTRFAAAVNLERSIHFGATRCQFKKKKHKLFTRRGEVICANRCETLARRLPSALPRSAMEPGIGIAWGNLTCRLLQLAHRILGEAACTAYAAFACLWHAYYFAHRCALHMHTTCIVLYACGQR